MSIKNDISKVIHRYAKVYQELEELQRDNKEGSLGVLPGGDQKTGVIAEFYAKCYIENQFKVKANYASSGSSWDINFLFNDKEIRVQVKGVSAHSKTRTIAPLRLKDQNGNSSFDQLYLIDLDFKPVGL
jgi:cytidylate kinase